MANGWRVGIEHDDRFGTLRFTLVTPEGENLEPLQIRVGDVLRAARIPADTMKAYLDRLPEPAEAPGDSEQYRLKAIADLGDLTGKVVLDVGGYEGYTSKLCLDQGASRAIVLDTEQYKHYGWPEKRHEGVEYVKGDLMDCLAPRRVIYDPKDGTITHEEGEEVAVSSAGEEFDHLLPRPDVVLLYNVLYHVRNPLAFLERAREIVSPDGTMLLCTLFRYHGGPWAYFYEPRECNPHDDSVFWGPSLECLERWLTNTGWTFERVGYAYDRVVYTCKPSREIAWRESRA